MNLPRQPRYDETFVLNLGPQHPATHGVLRVKVTMDGEYVLKAEPVLGYIHRMHEKVAENGSFAQFMPYTARMDYLHALAFNHGYCLVVERAAGIEVPERAEYIRVITVELNRIASHLLWWAAFLLDRSIQWRNGENIKNCQHHVYLHTGYENECNGLAE